MKCQTSSGMSSARLAQRRDRDGEDVQAVEEVGAEAALPHLALEVAVGGGDEAHVDARPSSRSRAARTRRSAARAAAWPARSSGSSPISSRKIVPPSATSKRPRVRGDRAGEGALLVAEQLALDERGGQGGAVHGDERPAPAGAARRGSRAPRGPCRCPSRRGSAPGRRSQPTCSTSRRTRDERRASCPRSRRSSPERADLLLQDHVLGLQPLLELAHLEEARLERGLRLAPAR